MPVIYTLKLLVMHDQRQIMCSKILNKTTCALTVIITATDSGVARLRGMEKDILCIQSLQASLAK